MRAHPALVRNADFQPLSYFPLSVLPWDRAVKAVVGATHCVVEECAAGIRHGAQPDRASPSGTRQSEGRPAGRPASVGSGLDAQALRIKTAAFRHGEVTGQESGARSKRDGWRQATGDQDLTSPPINPGRLGTGEPNAP